MNSFATALVLLAMSPIVEAATLLHVDCAPKEGPTIEYGRVNRNSMTNLQNAKLTEGRKIFSGEPITMRIDSDDPERVKLYWAGYTPTAKDDVTAGTRKYVSLLHLSPGRLAIVAPSNSGDHWLITVYPDLGLGLFTFHGTNFVSDVSGWMFSAKCRVITWPDK